MNDHFDPSGFDPDDPMLGRRLGRLAGPRPDLDAAFGTFQQRARSARRRRTAAWMMSGAAVLALFVMAAAALPGGDGSGRIVPAGTTDPTSIPDRTDAPSTSLPGSTTGPDGTTGPVSGQTVPGSPEAGDDEYESDESDESDDGSTEMASGDDGGAPRSETASTTKTTTKTTTKPSSPSTTTATTPPSTQTSTSSGSGGGGPVTKTCTSLGGSMTARYQGGTMSIVSTNPAPGWTLDESEASEDEAKAKFAEVGGEGQWEVRADWTGTAISCSTRSD